MKKVIDDLKSLNEFLEPLNEMATIGTYDNHKVTIYNEPLGNPSFHLTYKNDWEVVLQIKDFKILEVKQGSFVKGDYLPRKELNSLKQFLMRKSGKQNIWYNLLIGWNILNDKYQISSELDIPL
jgi:hypothetical protein